MARRFNSELLKRMCEQNVPPITPEQLADAVDVSRYMAQLWFRGAQPSLAKADKIARFFNKSLEFFLIDDEPTVATAGQ